jgi:MFS transporter, DHA2 family, multidrug resistance protein
MRNLGGSVGISFITTFLERRTQFHQARLAEHVFRSNTWHRETLHRMAVVLPHRGVGVHAIKQAYGMLAMNVQRQAALLSYIDTVHVLALFGLCAVTLVFLAKRVEPGRARMGH